MTMTVLEDVLDVGIAPWVLTLIKDDVATFESCQGGLGHAFTEPTIRFHGQVGEGMRVYALARTYGWPVQAVRRVWDDIDGELTGPVWEIVFWKDCLGYAPTDAISVARQEELRREWQKPLGDT